MHQIIIHQLIHLLDFEEVVFWDLIFLYFQSALRNILAVHIFQLNVHQEFVLNFYFQF